MFKTNLSFAAILAATLILFSNCSKKDSPKPTELKFTVADNLGIKISGASITLYLNQANWQSQTNSVGTGVTDANGNATITGLSPVIYFWRIEKGCQNNVTGTISSASALTANTTNTIGVTLYSTGTLRMVNTSASAFQVYVNGVLTLNPLAANTAQNLTNAPIGAYTIRVVKVGGGTDQTYTGNLTCGGTLTTTFP